MKPILLILALATAACFAADPIVTVRSVTDISVGQLRGKAIDLAVNSVKNAPAIQIALEAWADKITTDHEAALAAVTSERDAAIAEKNRLVAALQAAKVKASTAGEKNAIDGLIKEAQKTERATRREALAAEIAAKQAELSKLATP